MSGDSVEELIDPPGNLGNQLIELVDTVESELSLMDWGVHEARGLDRRHIHPSAGTSVDARVTYWHPPIEWKSSWRPPLKLPRILPPYKATLVKWCPPMWWPPTQIREGRLIVWGRPSERHILDSDMVRAQHSF